MKNKASDHAPNVDGWSGRRKRQPPAHNGDSSPRRKTPKGCVPLSRTPTSTSLFNEVSAKILTAKRMDCAVPPQRVVLDF